MRANVAATCALDPLKSLHALDPSQLEVDCFSIIRSSVVASPQGEVEFGQ